jgi:hypothetical protein
LLEVTDAASRDVGPDSPAIKGVEPIYEKVRKGAIAPRIAFLHHRSIRRLLFRVAQQEES